MTKQKDYYWTITKDEYLNKLKVLEDPYKMSIWNYLQAYIIRGRTDIPLWRACYNLYKAAGLLAANISVNRMSEDLHIGTTKIKGTLKELDNNDHVIKYWSKKGEKNNPNIYILGIVDSGVDNSSNIYRDEQYFINRTNEMSKGDRHRIIELFDTQVQTAKIIDATTKELLEIRGRLFKGIGHVATY